MPLTILVSFHVLSCPSLCGLQLVSAPHLVGFFLCPDLSLLCGLQLVSPWAWSISFQILTLSHLLSPGSEYPFNLLICFWCTDVFLHFSESEPFFYICPLPASGFSLRCFSASQLLFDKLRSFNSDVLWLFFLISSWSHRCTSSHLSVCLVMTYITP